MAELASRRSTVSRARAFRFYRKASWYWVSEVKTGSFVYERPGALPKDWCEEMIRRFEAHPEQQNEGRIGQVQDRDQAVKKTMDLVVSNKPDWKDVDRVLFRCMAAALSEFRETFP